MLGAVRRYGRCDKATSAIEFAIVCPVFVTILFGIIAYGIYFGAALSVSQLAADAARVSVAGITDAERRQLAIDHIDTTADGFVLLKGSAVTVTAEPLAADPDQFLVTVRYDATHLPIWDLVSFVPLPSSTIESSSTIRRGGY